MSSSAAGSATAKAWSGCCRCIPAGPDDRRADQKPPPGSVGRGTAPLGQRSNRDQGSLDCNGTLPPQDAMACAERRRSKSAERKSWPTAPCQASSATTRPTEVLGDRYQLEHWVGTDHATVAHPGQRQRRRHCDNEQHHRRPDRRGPRRKQECAAREALCLPFSVTLRGPRPFSVLKALRCHQPAQAPPEIRDAGSHGKLDSCGAPQRRAARQGKSARTTVMATVSEPPAPKLTPGARVSRQSFERRRFRREAMPISPAKAVPIRPSVPGSGTTSATSSSVMSPIAAE